ncbi:MAG: class C beta-lactamase-related serine hydrolase [Calditrichaeota bacterium]|nr:MAG: class C beta-lactamase-related serine hydrolase [Calditrichota bacterium]MBL1207038.1 class C beta-lactamase-related serine hydrolase [Calditrichota bacterium]NOG46866.1 serine hydrolase [Calditrichota bacterium]
MKIINIILFFCSIVTAQLPVNSVVLDTLIERMFTDTEYVGFSVIISNSDSIVYVNNSGVSDIKSQKQINHKSDVFRIASISKLFTTIAVLQQVEKGLLNLDEDINKYLDFSIPNKIGRPITLKHLLTHTAGFEDKTRGTYTTSIEQLQPLNLYLKEKMPDKIYPAGEITLYSNYSFALAGYIVERVSNEKFFDYITKFILQPLGMNESFVYEEDTFQDRIMPSYTKKADGSFEKFNTILYRNLSPAGMINATPYDMSRLMQLLLRNKELLNQNILSTNSIKNLLTIHHRYSPQVQGYGLSMYEKKIGDLKSMNIGGQLPSFSSQMSIINDSIGIYVCANTSMNRPLISLIDSLAFKLTTNSLTDTIGYKKIANPERYAGSYRWNRYNRKDLDYLRGLYANTKVLYYNDDGFFKFYGSPDKWIYQTEKQFREKNSGKYILFDINPDGSVKGIKGNLILDMPVYLERFKFIETGKILDNTIGYMLIIFFALPILWGIVLIIKKIRKTVHRYDKTFASKTISVLISGLFFLHLLLFRNILANYIDFVTDETSATIIIYHLSIIMLILLSLQFYVMIRDMLKKNISLFDRITFGILMFTGITYYLLMTKYNLFWFSL